MKPKFTLLQKIMTTLFIVLEVAVITGDVLKLFVLENNDNKYYYGVNLALCLLLLVVFMALIISPKAGVNGDETDNPESLLPQLSASRTYMCFIAVDIALIFAFVMYFSKYFENPTLLIIAGGVAIFIIGAIKYVIDCKRIGFEEFEDDDDDEEDDKPKSEEKPNTEEKPKTEDMPKTEDKPKTEEKPKTEDKSKSEGKPKTEDKPKSEEKPKTEEKPKPAPKKQNTNAPKKNYPAKKQGGKNSKGKKGGQNKGQNKNQNRNSNKSSNKSSNKGGKK